MERLRKSVAIVGGGVAGLGAAWLLGATHDVTLYEAGSALGGAARTVDFPGPEGPIPVDIGVSILEPWGNPNVLSLLDRLGVATDAAVSPFSASFGPGDEWVQGRIHETPLGRRISEECSRFELDAFRAAGLPPAAQRAPLRDWIAGRGYSDEFLYKALFPAMSLLVLTPEGYLDLPVSIYSFIFSHYFSFFSSTTWRTVRGGIRVFFEALAASTQARILLDTPVASVTRLPEGVVVKDARGGRAVHDQVILATRADTALSLLTDPTSRERELLRAFPYWFTRVTLHGDERALSPTLPREAVQYVAEPGAAGPELLGRLSFAARPDLERGGPVLTYSWREDDPTPAGAVAVEDEWMHTAPTARSLAARDRLHEIQGTRRTWFCGGWTLLNYHEAALVSGMAVAEQLGARYPFAGEALAEQNYQELRAVLFPRAGAAAGGKKAA